MSYIVCGTNNPVSEVARKPRKAFFLLFLCLYKLGFTSPLRRWLCDVVGAGMTGSTLLLPRCAVCFKGFFCLFLEQRFSTVSKRLFLSILYFLFFRFFFFLIRVNCGSKFCVLYPTFTGNQPEEEGRRINYPSFWLGCWNLNKVHCFRSPPNHRWELLIHGGNACDLLLLPLKRWSNPSTAVVGVMLMWCWLKKFN